MVHFKQTLYLLIFDGHGKEEPEEWLEKQKAFLTNADKESLGLNMSPIPAEQIDHEAIEWLERCYEEFRFLSEIFKSRLFTAKPKGDSNVQNTERGSSL